MVSGRRLVTMAGWALLYAIAGVAGRLTIVDGTALSLVWPAAGVAVAWLLLQHARVWGPDTVVLGATTFAVNGLTGAPWQMGLVFLVANLVQAWGTVALMRRWLRPLWGVGGSSPLATVRDSTVLLGLSALVTAVAAVVGTSGLRLVGVEAGLIDLLVWWGRNLCGLLAIVSLVLLVGERLARTDDTRTTDLRESAGEALAVFATSAAMFLVAFGAGELPLAFPLLITTVWAGLRLPTVVATVHAVCAGVTAVLFTLAAQGPFAQVADVDVGALLAQVFVAMCVVTSLVLATGRDERVRLAADLRHSEARSAAQTALLGSVFASVAEGIAVVDEGGRVLMANDATQRYLGLRAGDTVGDQVTRRPDGTTFDPGTTPVMRALDGETVDEADTLTEEGLTLATRASPLPPDEDGGSRAVMVHRDVSDDRARVRELTSFAGVVAHDLKNPLSVVEGWSEHLRDLLEVQEAAGRSVDPGLVLGQLARIDSAAGRMRGLITDLLAHATAADRRLELEPLDLSHLATEVAASRGMSDHVTVSPLPQVQGDTVLVRQVVDNLIGNALKYVAPGVTPDVSVVHVVPPGEQLVTVCVDDNGIGVPEGQHEQIFEQFHRAHAESYRGTGLGLAICHRIVERHGGRIWAEPNPAGGGSRFCFTLPAV